MTTRTSNSNTRQGRAGRHNPKPIGPELMQRANEAAKALPGNKRIVASEAWIRRDNTLSRRVLSLHSSDSDALLFSLQTVDVDVALQPSDQAKTQRLLRVSLTKADFPDWVGEILGEERGASFDKFISRCFALLKKMDIKLGPLLLDFLTCYNDLALEDVDDEGVLMTHTERDYAADVYGTQFEVRYEFTVTAEGYTCDVFEDDCPNSYISGGSGSLQDLFEGNVTSNHEQGLVERFQAFHKRLPDKSPLKRRLLLESASGTEEEVPYNAPPSLPPEPPATPTVAPFNNFGDRWLSEKARSADGQYILCRRTVWTGRWSLMLATDKELYPEMFVAGHTGCRGIKFNPESLCWTGTATFGHGQPRKKWTIDVARRSEIMEEVEAAWSLNSISPGVDAYFSILRRVQKTDHIKSRYPNCGKAYEDFRLVTKMSDWEARNSFEGKCHGCWTLRMDPWWRNSREEDTADLLAAAEALGGQLAEKLPLCHPDGSGVVDIRRVWVALLDGGVGASVELYQDESTNQIQARQRTTIIGPTVYRALLELLGFDWINRKLPGEEVKPSHQEISDLVDNILIRRAPYFLRSNPDEPSLSTSRC